MPSPITAFFKTDCTIRHVDESAARDEYGNVITAATTTTTRCYMAQQSRTEVGLDNIERERWAAYFPAGTTLDANDSVTVDGADYQVIGQPWPVLNPVTDEVDHVEATLERRR